MPEFRTAQVCETSSHPSYVHDSAFSQVTAVSCSTSTRNMLPPQGQHIKLNATKNAIHLTLMQDCHLEDYRKEAKIDSVCFTKTLFFCTK